MLTLVINPCPNAVQRQEAHRIERALAVGKLTQNLTEAEKRLKKVVPQLRDPFGNGPDQPTMEVRWTERSRTLVLHMYGRTLLSITEQPEP